MRILTIDNLVFKHKMFFDTLFSVVMNIVHIIFVDWSNLFLISVDNNIVASILITLLALKMSPMKQIAPKKSVQIFALFKEMLSQVKIAKNIKCWTNGFQTNITKIQRELLYE